MGAVLIAVPAPGRAVDAVVQEPPAPTAESAEAIIARHGFEPANVGYMLRHVESGKVVAAHNARTPFIPASVAKLPTAVTALTVLGGDHRFTTRVLASGEVASGTLRGNLVLKGGGDPLLAPADLMALCRQVRAAGIRRVEGALVYDAGRIPPRRAINPDQPADARYNPAVSSLTLDFNQLRVDWRPRGADGVVAATTVPPLPGIAFKRARRDPGPGQRWAPAVDDGRTIWKLDPGASRRGSSALPVKRPGRVTAQTFRRLCGHAGVSLPPPRPGTAPADARVVARHASPPLTRVVRKMLRYSNNLVAELVGLATSRDLTGKGLDLRASAATVAAWWHRRRTDVAWGPMHLPNHSGLSADARLTPAQTVAMLRDPAALGRPAAVPRGLPSLLAASGSSPGMDTRLDGPATALRVWAKTGTMFYGSGLAGYLYSRGGKRLAFAVFVNDKPARRAYDRDPGRRRSSVQAAANAWLERAKDLETSLVRAWVRNR